MNNFRKQISMGRYLIIIQRFKSESLQYLRIWETSHKVLYQEIIKAISHLQIGVGIRNKVLQTNRIKINTNKKKIMILNDQNYLLNKILIGDFHKMMFKKL